MSIVKLIAGIILFVAGLFLSLAVIFSLTELRPKVDFSNANGIGYFVGSVIMVIIFTAVSFFMMKYGVRLTKRKS